MLMAHIMYRCVIMNSFFCTRIHLLFPDLLHGSLQRSCRSPSCLTDNHFAVEERRGRRASEKLSDMTPLAAEYHHSRSNGNLTRIFHQPANYFVCLESIFTQLYCLNISLNVMQENAKSQFQFFSKT